MPLVRGGPQVCLMTQSFVLYLLIVVTTQVHRSAGARAGLQKGTRENRADRAAVRALVRPRPSIGEYVLIKRVPSLNDLMTIQDADSSGSEDEPEDGEEDQDEDDDDADNE